MSKIISLEAESFKRLKAVKIEPTGNVTVIGGRNEQGKTSTLDAVWAALGGKNAVPEKPIHGEEKKGKIVLTLDDYTVTRTFTAAGGGTLKVENSEGASFKSPQSILDSLCGKVGFDALAFVNSDKKKQLQQLKELVGLDFTGLDNRYKQIFEDRTIANRDVKDLAARLDAMPCYDDAPESEVSVSELMQELQFRESENNTRNDVSLTISNRKEDIDRFTRNISSLKDKQAEIQRIIDGERQNIETYCKELEQLETSFMALTEYNTNEVRQQIADADGINQKVRANKQRAELEKDLIEKREASQGLSDKLKAILDDKQKQLASAEFPIKGLSFDDNGVLYQGYPLSQASGAGKLRIGVSIAAAMNPKLKLMLIRDASLLDDDGMKIIQELAEEKGVQVIMERVGKGSECGYIIEDGMIEEQ